MKRAVASFAGAAVASVALAVLLPAGGASALRATILAFPFLVSLAETLAASLGAEPASGIDRLLALAWLAAASHADALAVPAADRLLFVALLVLVALRLGRLLAPLVRRFAASRDRRSAYVALFVLVPGLAIAPWVDAEAPPNGDEPYYLLIAESLTSDADIDLSDEYLDGTAQRIAGRELAPQQGDPIGRHGERRSRHGALFPLLLAPAWMVGGVLGSRLVVLTLWALLAEAMARLARAFGAPPRAAVLGALVAALGAPLIFYCAAIWIEVPAALAVAVALEAWAGDERLRGGRGWRFAAALCVLPLLKMRFLLLAAPLAALAVSDRRLAGRWRWTVAVSAGLAGALILALNWWTTGNPLRVYGWGGLLASSVPWTDYPLALDGLLFDLAFGLTAAAPIWLLALTALPRVVGRHRVFALASLAHLPYLAAIATRREWFGGWSPPFRYGIVLLPLLSVALAEQWARPASRRFRTVRVALALATLLLTVTLLAEPGWARSFADGRARWVDLAAAPFAQDLARFLPSATRPRLATWLAPALLLLLALPSRRIRPRRRAPIVALGWTLLAVTWIAWIAAANTVPTRRAELEDPWVRKTRGALFPKQWTFDRTRFASGWRLDRRARAAIVPVRGGRRARVTVRYRSATRQPRVARLRLTLDGIPVGTLPVEATAAWQLGSLDVRHWRTGAELGLRVLRPAPGAPGASVLVDYVDFDWR